MRAGAGWVAQLVGVWSVVLYTKKVACLIPVRVCAYGCNQSMFLSPLPSSSLLKSIIYPWVRIKKKSGRSGWEASGAAKNLLHTCGPISQLPSFSADPQRVNKHLEARTRFRSHPAPSSPVASQGMLIATRIHLPALDSRTWPVMETDSSPTKAHSEEILR